MAGGWIDDGAVSVPPRTLAYGAGALVLVAAVLSAGLGFDAAWRRDAAPGLSSAGPANRAGDLVAKPIVELARPTAAPSTSGDESADDKANDAAKADALAAQTAAAQALQGKANAKGDIDDIMTSPTEKPPAPVKAPADEAPPPNTAPLKSDVPF